jgi:hypothetical protein
MYAPDPVALIRGVLPLLRPGGIVAFQEPDLREPPRSYLAAPLHEQVLRWTALPPGTPGPDIEAGPKLFRTFVEAGLPAPQLCHGAPAGGGPDWPGYAYTAATIRSLLPFLERVGVIEPGRIDVDSLEEGLRTEVVQRSGIQILPALFGAWVRTGG